jgi:pimeloyl-ACP methyl ester carboxylesterase
MFPPRTSVPAATAGAVRLLARETLARRCGTCRACSATRYGGAGREEREHELGILLVPGFCARSSSLALTRRWLQPRGFDPRKADIGFDIGCTGALVDRLEEQLAEHVRDTGGRILLLGHSRGGGLARPAAARRPDLVRGLIMLGPPVVDGGVSSGAVPRR